MQCVCANGGDPLDGYLRNAVQAWILGMPCKGFAVSDELRLKLKMCYECLNVIVFRYSSIVI